MRTKKLKKCKTIIVGCLAMFCIVGCKRITEVESEISRYHINKLSTFSVIRVQSEPRFAPDSAVTKKEFLSLKGVNPPGAKFIQFEFALDSSFIKKGYPAFQKHHEPNVYWFNEHKIAFVLGSDKLLGYLKNKYKTGESVFCEQSAIYMDETNGIYLLPQLYSMNALNHKLLTRIHP